MVSHELDALLDAKMRIAVQNDLTPEERVELERLNRILVRIDFMQIHKDRIAAEQALGISDEDFFRLSRTEALGPSYVIPELQAQ